MEINDLRYVKEEQIDLEQRLKNLKKIQNKMVKRSKKPFSSPLKKQKFRRQVRDFEYVSSQINYDLIKEKQIKDSKRYEKVKEQLEMAECTFSPQLNMNSVNIVGENHIAPHQKELPRKENSHKEMMSEDEMDEEEGMEVMPKNKRKFDPSFYKKQIQWKKRNIDRQNKERMKKTLKEISKLKGIPITNKKKNLEMVKDGSDFLTRMENHQKNSNRLKQKLDKKYWSKTFRPAIHHKNPVKPLVYENGLYASLKR